MANVSTTSYKLPLADRVHAFWTELMEKAIRRKIYRTTLEELRRLSDRELDDMGFSRWQIEKVALNAAYGENSL